MIESMSSVRNRLIAISTALSTLPSLAPSPAVDALFNELVSLVLAYRLDAEVVLSDASFSEHIPTLQSLSARGEAALETYWSQRIASSTSPAASLTEFPYYKNYDLLVRSEQESLVDSPLKRDSQVLFVGGGPLPLSAILLAIHTGASITCLDTDVTATALAKRLVTSLALTPFVSCITGAVDDVTEWETYTHVIVAALAGLATHEKLHIARVIADRAVTSTHVLWRGSDALGVLLYPPLPRTLRVHLMPVHHVPSQPPIINTIDIFSVRMPSTYCTTSQWEAVTKLLTQYDTYKMATTQDEKSSIGDAMFYDDPVIWMLYKALAYQGTASAVTTLGDLRRHAADEQDICGRRFKFLLTAMWDVLGIDLHDMDVYPNNMSLMKLADSQVFSDVVSCNEIMKEWRRQEYYCDASGRVEKWQATIA